MTLAVILAIAMFFAIMMIVLGLTSISSSSQSDLLEARLAQFSETGRMVTSLTEAEMSLPFAERVLKPMIDRAGKIFAGRLKGNQASLIQEQLNLAGRPGGLTAGGFVALRMFGAVAGLAVGFLASLLLGLDTPMNIAAIAGFAVFGYLIPKIYIDRRIKRRQKEILLGLPSALDLLTISVEAGLGFDAALQRVTEKYHNALSYEFQHVLNEVRLGRPRVEALDDMGRRNKVEELNNFVQAIIQSEQLGVGIANVLRIQSEEIRRRRRQRAEEAGQKAPLKMLFPMVGCIFPTLFIVLLGPAVISIKNQFLK